MNFYKKINFLPLFCIGLIWIRIIYLGKIHLGFLLWNLFLAWIPYQLSVSWDKQAKYKAILCFLLCVLFFPNAIYLITDLVHLRPRSNIPFWFDVLLLFSFSVMGLLYATLTLIQIERKLRQWFSIALSQVLFFTIVLLSGYGVYIGRVLRWNSWDVFTNPIRLIIDCSDKVFHPWQYPAVYGYTFLFAALQLIFWYVFKDSTKKN